MFPASPSAPVAGDTGRSARAPLRPLVLALAGTLVGLWALLHWPAAATLVEPYTVLTATATAQALTLLGLPLARAHTVLVHPGGFAVEVDLACTALVPAALLTAAILAWPRPWRSRLAVAAGGIAWLVLVNQLRLMSLVWVGVYAPAGFDLLHRWVWPALLALAAAGYFCAGRGTPCERR